MCGICGKISNKPLEHNIIQSMNQSLYHRGPDDEGIYLSNDNNCKWFVGLGHRRLSIIDLSKEGHQPMYNEDSSILLVANGEIYNYRELSDILEKFGHKFRSKSDSEIIIHAYEQWGMNCLQKIKGMFAFAIWDKNQESLIIARDLCGEKPLFYTLDNHSLTFASELPTLLKCGTVSHELNKNALLQYFHYQMIFSPDTILKNIKKLPPGHVAVYKNGNLTITNYTDSIVNFDNNKNFLNIKYCADKLIHSLEKIIEPVMVSDVPVGLFLSGGLDSSLILALMAKKQNNPIHTFSIGFEQSGFNELSWARKVANHFGTHHHEEVVNMDILNVLPDVIDHLGEPMADASVIPYYYLSKLAASHVKVVLGGDGADEVWGGYRRHILRPFLRFFSKTAPIINKIACKFSASDGYYASSLIESFKLAEQLAYAQDNGYMPWNPVFSKEELSSLVSIILTLSTLILVNINEKRQLKIQ
ncbi:MAG: asparagine synthase (glutamine-hydrolyzing) [Desulfobacteraceae bacterium 4572_19]|nr:MAG: asparagine synthase (glutamine-hydrolyzing) [Desulfobacteraceae bacterium 4572_19]